MKVIDISDWQEGINFDDIVNAGVEGVIIKALNGQSPTTCVYDFIDECRNTAYRGASIAILMPGLPMKPAWKHRLC